MALPGHNSSHLSYEMCSRNACFFVLTKKPAQVASEMLRERIGITQVLKKIPFSTGTKDPGREDASLYAVLCEEQWGHNSAAITEPLDGNNDKKKYLNQSRGAPKSGSSRSVDLILPPVSSLYNHRGSQDL